MENVRQTLLFSFCLATQARFLTSCQAAPRCAYPSSCRWYLVQCELKWEIYLKIGWRESGSRIIKIFLIIYSLLRKRSVISQDSFEMLCGVNHSMWERRFLSGTLLYSFVNLVPEFWNRHMKVLAKWFSGMSPSPHLFFFQTVIYLWINIFGLLNQFLIFCILQFLFCPLKTAIECSFWIFSFSNSF